MMVILGVGRFWSEEVGFVECAKAHFFVGC